MQAPTLAALVCVALCVAALGDDPMMTYDLRTPRAGELLRVAGYTGNGDAGTPVCGGGDVDGDGYLDYALASMKANPNGRTLGGEVYLVFGDGTIDGTINTGVAQPRVLKIQGDQTRETAGCEIWMDDITGDGYAELLICRQNYSPTQQRIGAGALTILIGGPETRAYAAGLQPLDLRNPPPSLRLCTFIGVNALDRLGIWARTGDVDGDGILDLLTAADQADFGDEINRGELFVIRGGPHLAAHQTIDLRNFGSTALEGHITRIRPPIGSGNYHLGSTNYIADLDGDGRAEVMASAALSRAGAGITAAGAPAGSAQATGGSPRGTLFIVWGDNFAGNPWPAGYTFNIAGATAGKSIIGGGAINRIFGEEIVGALDYDGDRHAELFVGDFAADGTAARNRPSSGVGYVFYHAALLRDRIFTLDNAPADIRWTTILGNYTGAIAADTVMHGDCDGDGLADLAFGSPHANPAGRLSAGTIHVLYGKPGGWPSLIDTAPERLPPSSQVRTAEILGARGFVTGDSGDTLCYSGASADINGDGRIDLITNEMLGNGVGPGTIDVGNLLIISGAALLNAPSRSIFGIY